VGATNATFAIAEMQEFASFSPATQRYIRRSIGIVREPDAVERYSRDPVERVSITVQKRCYERLPELRERVPEHSGLDRVEPFMAPLVGISAFDLSQDRLESFQAYRFLYERLIGAAARPWLLGAFCAVVVAAHRSGTTARPVPDDHRECGNGPRLVAAGAELHSGVDRPRRSRRGRSGRIGLSNARRLGG
jgi:hypothetical protein